MSELTDIQIKAWIKNDERFEQRGDGGGLRSVLPPQPSTAVFSICCACRVS